jgi:hypothetical protein
MIMPKLQPNLILDRCPHCSVANPNLLRKHHLETKDHGNQNRRVWSFYCCGRCGGIVTASAPEHNNEVLEIFPDSRKVSDDIPARARSYLEQAISSIHAPSGAVMLCASSVDAMLKNKGYSSGSLYKRIEKAVADNLITSEMAKWAHDVRLDANDERHADEEAIMPTEDDANRTIDFVSAFAEYLFVLPAKVKRGMNQGQD